MDDDVKELFLATVDRIEKKFDETAADAGEHFVRGLSLRTEIPPSAEGRGKLTIKLRVGPGGLAEYDRSEDCSE